MSESWVSGIFLSQSQNFGFLILIGIVFLLIWNTSRFRQKMLRAWGLDAKKLETNEAFLAPKNRKIKTTLYAFGILFVFFAALGPQWGEKSQILKSEGIDICIGLDLSQSMLADDMLPSRLKAAKNQLSYFLPRLGGDRIALVGFAGTSFIAAPLTPDISALLSFLEPLDTGYVSDPSTRISVGVEGCLNALGLEAVTSRDDLIEGVSQIIFLVTDGEDRDPDSAAVDRAARLGVPVVSLAVGTKTGARIPTRNDRGEIVNYLKRPRSGEYVLTKLEDSGLLALAKKTGGKVFYLSEGNVVWDSVEDFLGGFQKRTQEAGLQVDREHRFQILLILAFLLLLLDFFLTEIRRSQFRTKSWFLLLLFGLNLGRAPCSLAQSLDPGVVYYNRRALNDFDVKDLSKSLDSLKQALSRDANDLLTRSNFLTHSLIRSLMEENKEASQELIQPVLKECEYLLLALYSKKNKSEFDQALKAVVQHQCALAHEKSGNLKEAIKLHYLNYDAPKPVADIKEKAKNNVIRLLEKQKQQEQQQSGQNSDSQSSENQNSGQQGSKQGEGQKPQDKNENQKFSEGDKDRKTRRPFKNSELSESQARKILESVSGEESAVKKRKTQNEQRMQGETGKDPRQGPSGDPW